MRYFDSGGRKPGSGEGKDDTGAHRRISLLVVDESAAARDAMARRLSLMGHDVMLSECGFSALALLLVRRFDLIIIDMGMKILSSIETMQRMRAIDASHTPVMMITGRSDSAAAITALDAGADDQIFKPFDFDMLDARIRHIVGRARRMGELALHNAQLDARIARRAMELGETRDALGALEEDRARLAAAMSMLEAEVARLRGPLLSNR